MKNVDNLKLWCLFRQRLSLQGEQNIVSAIDNALGKLGFVINSDNEIVSDEKQGEKPAEWTAEDEEELKIALNTLEEAGQYSSAKWLKNVCLVPQTMQKLAEWSEEDERQWNNIWDVLDGRFELSEEGYKNAADWFKSIKERVQPQLKQEWGEEDEKRLKTIISFMNSNPAQDPFYDKGCLENWLKSLKPHWKPSDEQMRQLHKYCPDNMPLTALYEQLKKLKD